MPFAENDAYTRHYRKQTQPRTEDSYRKQNTHEWEREGRLAWKVEGRQPRCRKRRKKRVRGQILSASVHTFLSSREAIKKLPSRLGYPFGEWVTSSGDLLSMRPKGDWVTSERKVLSPAGSRKRRTAPQITVEEENRKLRGLFGISRASVNGIPSGIWYRILACLLFVFMLPMPIFTRFVCSALFIPSNAKVMAKLAKSTTSIWKLIVSIALSEI